MVEILNSNQYAPPIIVFVNQKKTADMVAKDLHRAGVRTEHVSTSYDCSQNPSGVLQRCTRARIKSSERQPCNRCGMVLLIFSLPRTLQGVVSMYRMSVWLSTTKWPTLSRHMFTVLVRTRLIHVDFDTNHVVIVLTCRSYWACREAGNGHHLPQQR